MATVTLRGCTALAPERMCWHSGNLEDTCLAEGEAASAVTMRYDSSSSSSVVVAASRFDTGVIRHLLYGASSSVTQTARSRLRRCLEAGAQSAVAHEARNILACSRTGPIVKCGLPWGLCRFTVNGVSEIYRATSCLELKDPSAGSDAALRASGNVANGAGWRGQGEGRCAMSEIPAESGKSWGRVIEVTTDGHWALVSGLEVFRSLGSRCRQGGCAGGLDTAD
ncbi:hypothetical protein DFP72DRAFT_840662 [Ephemerocybe angulata]|uniref:Uncharacterized protein n=1 Tax=Ephemerocybe angulata TaxID=980116 RepID=A0A8H6IDD0_9AGAR|nr:hypothetical protein DFP72DRAFT_840662 [Tulosesus angulatus]